MLLLEACRPLPRPPRCILNRYEWIQRARETRPSLTMSKTSTHMYMLTYLLVLWLARENLGARLRGTEGAWFRSTEKNQGLISYIKRMPGFISDGNWLYWDPAQDPWPPTLTPAAPLPSKAGRNGGNQKGPNRVSRNSVSGLAPNRVSRNSV